MALASISGPNRTGAVQVPLLPSLVHQPGSRCTFLFAYNALGAAVKCYGVDRSSSVYQTARLLKRSDFELRISVTQIPNLKA